MAFKAEATLGEPPRVETPSDLDEGAVYTSKSAAPKFKPEGTITPSGSYDYKAMGESLLPEYKEPKTGLERAKDVTKAAGIGGVIGAFTPEILTGLGLAAAPFPLTAPLSAPLLTAGQVARGSRLGTAAATALYSGGAKLAGETVEAMGAGEKPIPIPGTGKTVPAKELTENVVAFGAPAVAGAAKSLILKAPLIHNAVLYFKQAGGKSNYAEAAARELANFRNRVKVNDWLQSNRPSARMSEVETQPYRELFSFIQSKDEATQAQVLNQISIAQKQADEVLASYSLRANEMLGKNQKEAQRLINEGDTRAKQIIDDAVNQQAQKLGIARRAESAVRRAAAAPTQTLTAIGDVNATNAQIGGSLQQRVVNNLTAEQRALSAQYNADRNVVNNIVAQNEAAGRGVNQTAAFADLKTYLDSKLLRGKFGQQAKFAPVTETQQRGVYENIRKAIEDQQVFMGINEAGQPVYRDVPTSFEALDHVRRKLGEVYDGKVVEGYEGLLKEQAKDLYGKIRKIQVEYTNGAYDDVLKKYAEGKGAVNQLGIPTGKKLTKTDVVNPEYLTYDPSGLPNEFFSSRKKVADLINLTRDAGYVEQQAANHIARSLKDKDAKFAERYVYDNKEWLDLFPGLQNRVNAHVAALKRTESIVPKSEALAKTLRTEVKALPGIAEKEAAATRKEAAAAAKTLEQESKKEAAALMREGKEQAKVLSAGAKQAQALLGKGDPVVEIEKIITSGQTQRLMDIAPLIKESPEAMRSFDQALKITLSRENPTGIYDKWERIMRPALTNTGLINPAEAAEISKRINTVRLTLEPNAAAQTMISIIRNGATAKLAGSLTGE